MRVFVCGPAILLLCFVTLLVVAGPAMAEGEASDCAICHDEVVAAFHTSGHGIASGIDPAAQCSGCHGPGEAHVDGGGDIDAIVRPQVLPPRESSEICLACHQQHEADFSGRKAMHHLDDVACLDCHAAHGSGPGMLARKGIEVCADCHRAVAGQFELPRSHPLDSEGQACAACHEPHTARTLRISRATQDRECGTCHFEKVGPFVYNHDTLFDDGCSACHTVHGSANRHLLRHESQVNLCYECHSATFTPGFHNAATYVNQKCTACHSAIHGSNTNQLFLED